MNIQPYLILAFLWIIYFTLHSLLAAGSIKERLGKAVGRYYRLLYVFFSIFALLPILYYNAVISSQRIIPANVQGTIKFIGMVFATYGVIIIRIAFRHYSIRKFLGLKPASADELEPLYTSGIFQYIRHPIYAGTLLIFIGFWLYAPTIANLISVLMIIIYIFIGIQLEEKRLLATYGAEYEAYKAQVPMLIPALPFRRH